MLATKKLPKQKHRCDVINNVGEKIILRVKLRMPIVLRFMTHKRISMYIRVTNFQKHHITFSAHVHKNT